MSKDVTPSMICTCNDEDKKRAEELRERVKAHIVRHDKAGWNPTWDLHNILVYTLDQEYDVKWEVVTDQWLVVIGTTKDGTQYYCQADQFLDGLCSLYEQVAMKEEK